MIEVNEVMGAGYFNRTALNARSADLTIALAVNYNSGGERLTRTVAGKRYLALPLSRTASVSKEKLLNHCIENSIRTINVAGNSISTLNRGNDVWSQKRINNYLYEVIEWVNSNHKIDYIVCGGQTGVDIAGAVAARALGIKVIMNLPENYVQRSINGVDYENTMEGIIQQVEEMVLSLEKVL